MYFRCWVAWLLLFQSACDFSSSSTFFLVLYELVIIDQIFNDELLLSLGCKALLSRTACRIFCAVLPVQHDWEGQLWATEKMYQVQKGEGGSYYLTLGCPEAIQHNIWTCFHMKKSPVKLPGGLVDKSNGLWMEMNLLQPIGLNPMRAYRHTGYTEIWLNNWIKSVAQ